MKNNEPNLIELATTIRDETMPEKNTATRVGSLLILMVEKQESVDNALDSKVDISVINTIIERYNTAIESLKTKDKDHDDLIDGLVNTDIDFEQRMKSVEGEFAKIGNIEGKVSDLVDGCTMRFDGFAMLGSVAGISVEQPLSIRFHTQQQVFVAEYDRGKWCNNWPSRYQYMDDEGHVRANKLFLFDSSLYCWSTERNRIELIQGGEGGEGSDPSDLRRRVEVLENELAQLRELLTV